jgi:hypothetical protein
MFRTVAAIAAVFLGGSAFAAPNTSYFEICDKPSGVLGAFLGPKLIAPKDPAFASVLTAITTKHKAYTVDALKKMSTDGVFASSPYLLVDTKREEKIDRICVMFGVGGVALGIQEAIRRIQDLFNADERNSALEGAMNSSNEKCLAEARKQDRTER